MIYQHPLAYLLALQGGALLRAFNGEYDRDFTRARLAEIRALLDSAGEFGDGVTTSPITAEEGYDSWAGRYDDEPNDLVEAARLAIWKTADDLPVGVALDAACGTAFTPLTWRHAATRSSGSTFRPRCWRSLPRKYLAAISARATCGSFRFPTSTSTWWSARSR